MPACDAGVVGNDVQCCYAVEWYALAFAVQTFLQMKGVQMHEQTGITVQTRVGVQNTMHQQVCCTYAK